MKLLAVAIPHHDANLAYFDGERVRYIKLERTRQEKRFHFAELADWRREAEDLWGVDLSEVDDCAFTFDPGALPADLHVHFPRDFYTRLALGHTLAEPLPPPVSDYLGVRRGWLVGHHHLHALSSWMLEPRAPDLAIVIDGVGDGRSWSVYRHDGLVAMGPIQAGSIGWGMREAGKLLGVSYGHFNDIAGKVMGLQSHGRVDQRFRETVKRFGMSRLRDVWSPRHWAAHVGDPLVARQTQLDWIATVHAAMGDVLLDFFGQFARPDQVISYSGGVAQNVAWNAVLKARFPGLVVPPHASDEGLSLGGLEWLRRRHGLPKLAMPGFPYAQSDTAVAAPSAATLEAAAQLLAKGKVVGWYQGHGEIGPRALGHRSILLDPRLPQGKARLNQVKQREPYRPFGAAILQEHFDRHFEGAADEYMLYACHVRDASLPAVTHVDGTCRVQLVPPGSPLRPLLERFHQLTGCPALLNTSLNLAGRPLAAAPDHARQLFGSTSIDAVCIGDELLAR